MQKQYKMKRNSNGMFGYMNDSFFFFIFIQIVQSKCKRSSTKISIQELMSIKLRKKNDLTINNIYSSIMENLVDEIHTVNPEWLKS